MEQDFFEAILRQNLKMQSYSPNIVTNINAIILIKM